MNKVVYNGDYGGFSIPEKVCERYNEIAGTNYINGWDMCDIPRHDPLLVQLVEEYIKNHKSDLRISEITGDRYRIDEYDGWESVIEPNDQEWVVIK